MFVFCVGFSPPVVAVLVKFVDIWVGLACFNSNSAIAAAGFGETHLLLSGGDDDRA